MTSSQRAPVVRTYVAESYEAAIRDFQADAEVMAQHGYQPTSQQWVADDAGRGCFWLVIIVILFVTIIGIIFLPFVMKDRKKGTLTVTYTYVAATSPVQQEVRTAAAQPVAAPAPPSPAPPIAAPRSASKAPDSASELPTKVCPDCAETILEAARICRFCRHEFWPEGAPPPASAPIEDPEAAAQGPADIPAAPGAMMGREELVLAQEPQPESQPAPPWEPSPPQPGSEEQAPQPPAPPPSGSPPPYAPQQPPYAPSQPTYPPPPPTWQAPPQRQPPGQAPPPQGPGPWHPPPPLRPPDRHRE